MDEKRSPAFEATTPNCCQSMDTSTHAPTCCSQESDFIMPRDWTTKQKWRNVILISFQAAFTPITSTMLAAGSEMISKDFNIHDNYTPRLPVSLYILALGIGPMFLAPLSEIYGRRMIYVCCFACFSICNLICGFAPNMAVLAAFRFFSGLAGSASTTLSGATVGDMFVPAERARAQAIYGCAPLLGPVIGGIAGGYIVNGTGNWRWAMWIMTILPALSSITCFIWLRETYAPFLRRKYGIVDFNETNLSTQRKPNFSNTILRPIRLLIFSPTCTIMALYVGFGYGIFYFHIVTVPMIFGPIPKGHLFSYQWNASNTGLAYLGLGTGSIIGVVLAATLMNKSYHMVLGMMNKTANEVATATADLESRVAELEALIKSKPWTWKKDDCEEGCNCNEEDLPEYEAEEVVAEEEEEEEIDCPEARLPFMGVAMVIAPIGLSIFAWTIGPNIHWIVPLIGAGTFALGTMMAYVSIQNYLVDCFGDYSASALAATALLRAPLACGLSMISFEAYEKLNYSWGTMVLAFTLIIMLPGIVGLFFWGHKIRGMGRNS